MTPVGIAVDGPDRVYVLESHTHPQTSDYKRPRSDRVRVLTDNGRDGTPGRVSVVSEDLTYNRWLMEQVKRLGGLGAPPGDQ